MTSPLSQTQMGIYMTCMNQQEEGNYNIDMLYTLDAEVDTERLAGALDKVIEAHPYVKSRLVADENGEVRFEDHSDEEFHALVSEIGDIEEVRAHLGADFDLMQDRLFRLEIYKTPKGNYLYVDFHHIIFDGFSFKVFIDDLVRAYDGEALEAEQLNGADVARQEAEERQSAKYEEAKAWYAQEYGAASEVDSMPLADVYGDPSTGSGQVQEAHYARKYVRLGVDAAAKEAVCQKAGVRESVLFTAAFGLTLSKYAGEDEVLYNTIYHGRQNEATHRAFTMMVKTLPVYHNLAKTLTVVELLQQTKVQNLGARRNACYSYGDVATELGVKSDINFAYQGAYHTLDITLGGRKLDAEELITNTPGIKFLAMVMIEDGEYHFWLEYQQNKYSEAFIDGFIATYEHILGELCQRETLAEVTVCGEEMLRKLDSFNAKAYDDYNDDDDDETVLSMFQKAAKQYPDNIAAVFKEKQYTYRQLDELTDRIGALIYNKVMVRRAHQPEDWEPVVSILIPRNEYMFILPLSAMKAGCAYQPLDPSYPQERLNFMVKDADAALLIADKDLRPIINEYEGEALLTDELLNDNDNENENENSSLFTLHSERSEALFILLYTSGSTGVPKGVMLEHQNLVAFIKWYRRYYDLKPEHNVAAYASFGFDANMMDMYPALTTGATLHVVAEELRLDLAALNEYFEQNHITHSFITTQVGVQFLLNADNHSLKHLSVGGEKLMSVDPAQGYTFHNGYGPTECTIFSTTLPVLKKEPNIPIGKPTDELECYVMDKHLHRLPVGAAGELVIVGKQVGRGYLNRPDKTAEAFFTFGGKRAYHSGDIVRYREDGNIEFVGRKDGQVKIRGFRIELKEVEAVIRDFPGVSNVTVQAFDNPCGGKFIAAYVVMNDNDTLRYDDDDDNDNSINHQPSTISLDVEALNQFILSQKPPYMVPAVTMQIAEIPLNVNQKVDKKKLPVPEYKAEAEGEYHAPTTPVEEQLAQIISQVLNVEEVSIDMPLSALGLTSLTAMRLSFQIQKEMGVKVSTRKLVSGATIVDIEKLVAPTGNDDDNDDDDGNSKAATAAKAYPITGNQRGVYIDWEMNRDTTQYNIPSAQRMPGVTVEQLQTAIGSILDAHEYLFTRLVMVDGEVMQQPVVHKPQIPVTALDSKPDAEFFQQLVKPFDLFGEPLFRFSIYTWQDEVYLFADTHHIIMDGVSLAIMQHDMTRALAGESLTKEEYTAFDRAEEEEKLAHSGEWTEAEAHFDQLLSGINALSYPHSVGAITPGQNETVRVPVARKPIDEFCHRHNVTPSNYFLTMLMQVLHRVSREENVMITTINNGRADYRMQDIFGMFVKTLPIVSTVNPKTPDTKQTVVEAISQMQEQFFDAQERDFYPFTRMVERHGVEALICYAYQAGLFEGGTAMPSLGESFDLHLDTVKFPIDLNINDAPDGEYEITIDYDDTIYSHQDIVLLARMLRALSMNALQVQCIAEAGMLDAEEAKAVMAASQGRKMPVDASKTFVDIFLEQATQHADSVCVVSPEATYTYDQVNRRSNAVAHYLMAQGVGKGEFVCVSMLGCADFIVAAIGIEKAGAAYVPVDPEYPEDRKQYMQEDCEAKVVITEEELTKVDWTQDAPVNLTSPDGIAYMIYTSGSTGKPKGVMIPHSAKANFVQFIAQEWRHTAQSRICCHSSVSFDASIEDLYPVLTVGGALYIVPQEARKDMEQLHQFILNNGITGGCYTTQLGTMLLQQYPDLPVEYLVVGGEKMSANPACNCRLINTYGPTEFTVDATWFETEPGKEYKNIPIGRPLHNLAAYVVDQYGHLVPGGISGELCMAGPQMARGYWKREDLTAEKFCAARFTDGKIYHTGDLVKYNADGDIEYTGRIDSQVKLRGFRIELGEIETLIAGYEGVQMVSVQVRTIGGVQHLCAYYSADRQIDADALKEYLASQLTEYMVPTAYMQLDAMPLTPNGKVNTKALPEPQVAAREYVEPCGEVETFFCNTFAEILGIERVGATDSFFEIGGTSIVAMRVIVAAVKAGYEIVYKNIFDNPTPRELQALLTGKTVEADAATAANVDHEVVDYDYSAINKLLAGNTLEALRGGQMQEAMGVALVTGATGYLGVHVVHELLQRDDVPTVYCLVRGNKHMTAESRLRTQLFYYFGNTYSELFGTKLVVIDGDVTRPETFDCLLDKGIRTVFNCAANVKHFSAGTDIEDINIGGCNTCIDFCLKTGAQLIHTSTTSVAGTVESDHPVEGHLITETQLYWGQTLDNQYIHAKFIAERNVLEAIISHGLRAKIMRLGNLSSRSSDGEFQINFHSNSFMGQLKAFQTLGCISYDSLTDDMEFSPIDEVAKAITLLSKTPDACCIYQVVNSHRQIFGNVIECMRNIGIPVEMVEADVFNARVQEAAQDPVKAGILQSMLAYASDSDKYVAFNGENDVYTTQTLFRLGFRWSFTTWDYMEQFLAAIQSLGFFDADYQR